MELVSTEYAVLVPLRINRKACTYNPDFYCPETGYYIEVTTSRSNISLQREKWRKAMKRIPLLVYWWQGIDLTPQIKRSKDFPRF